MSYSTRKVIIRRRNEAKKLNVRGGIITFIGLILTIAASALEGTAPTLLFNFCFSITLGIMSIGLIGLVGGAGFQYLAEADFLATKSPKI